MKLTTALILLLMSIAAGLGEAAAQEGPGEGPLYSLSVGAGGPYAWNFVAFTAEYFPTQNDNVSLFVTGGFGTILIGGGAAWYATRPDEGLFATATAGLTGAHVHAGYQLPINERLSATAGVGVGAYFLQHNGLLPFASVVYRW